MSRRKTFIFISVILALGLLAVCVWRYAPFSNANHVAPAKSLPAVSVAVATSGSISRTIDLDGTVEAAKIARMSSPAEGPVLNCQTIVREGDHVNKGQLIVCIGRDKTINAQLAAAQSDLIREKAELDRVTELVKNGAIPGDQLEIARARHENVKAQLARIEESQKDYSITAPWGGVVSRVMVLEGDYVAPRTPLIEIFDPASLVARFAVPEADSQSVEIGKAVSVKLDAYPEKNFQARIVRIYPKLDPGTRTRIIEAVLTEKVAMMPGLFARIKMAVQTHENTVLVPAGAVIVTAAGDRLVYVIGEGKAAARKVSTGIEAGSIIEILSGVKPGEQIVVAGNEKLKDGMAVKMMEKQGEPNIKTDAVKPATAPGEGTSK